MIRFHWLFCFTHKVQAYKIEWDRSSPVEVYYEIYRASDSKKILKRGIDLMWSKTKKHLESFICDPLKQRVEYRCSNYRIHDGIGRTYITVDGKEVLNMCTLKRDYYRTPVEGTYSQVEFIETVYKYFNLPIEECLNTHNPLVKILVILDRRIGKRTLLNMKEGIEAEEDIVKYFYKLRCDAEGIDILGKREHED